MPLCYVTYIICILIVLHCHWADLIRLHFTSSYALYNYYVTNKETLNLGAQGPVSERRLSENSEYVNPEMRETLGYPFQNGMFVKPGKAG